MNKERAEAIRLRVQDMLAYNVGDAMNVVLNELLATKQLDEKEYDFAMLYLDWRVEWEPNALD